MTEKINDLIEDVEKMNLLTGKSLITDLKSYLD
jgi:hypothetical protein